MNNGQGVPGDAEFDRLWALEQGETAPVQQDPKVQGDGVAPAPAAAAPTPESSGGQAASGDAGAVGGIGTAQSPDATDVSQDWLVALPDDVRKRVEDERAAAAKVAKDAEDRYNALHGRLAPTQQALADAQRRLAQIHTPPAVTTPAPASTPEVNDSFFDSPTFKQYEADFPGDAKVLRAGFEAQQSAMQQALAQQGEQIQRLNQRLGQTEQVASRNVLEDEISKLEKAHPDWREHNDSDAYWEWFESWRAAQPKSMRGTYYDPNALKALMEDSEFVGARLTEFKATLPPPDAAATAQPSPTAQPESTQPTQHTATDVRLTMGVAPEVRGGSPVPQAVDINSLPEAQQFEYLWNNTP